MVLARHHALLAVLILGCGKSASDQPAPVADRPALDARPTVAATDYLPLTEEPIGELPDLAYQPAHTDAEYLAIEGIAIPLHAYINPLDERAVDARSMQIEADFQRVLGRTISAEDSARWKRDTIEDFRRRRLAARALLDLHLAGTLTGAQIEARFATLQEGIDLAFRRITGVTADEHARLAGG